MNIKEYEQAIKIMLVTEGLQATDKANHMALKRRKISLEQFQAGARILAQEVLKR